MICSSRKVNLSVPSIVSSASGGRNCLIVGQFCVGLDKRESLIAFLVCDLIFELPIAVQAVRRKARK